MKAELRLLYAAIDQEDRAGLFSTRTHMIDKKAIPVFAFVKTFYVQHGQFPDITTVEGKFNVFLDANTEPVKHWQSEIRLKYQEKLIEEAILNAAQHKDDAVEIFQTALSRYHIEDEEKGSRKYGDGSITRFDRYEQVKKNGGIVYLSTGSDDIDEISMGYRRADLWTLAGGEGAGKTFVLLHMANFLDLNMKLNGLEKEILFVTLEVDIDECEERMDAIRFKLPYGNFTRGKLTKTQEIFYRRNLNSLKTNIRFIDGVASVEDLESYIEIYQPAAVFLDGSHLLAKTYDWQEVANLTARLKKLTRLKKVPIVNTTHIKSERGKDGKGASIDDLAYSKGYTRDSDIVGVMFASDLMKDAGQFGIDWVKIRRGKSGTKQFFEMDFEKMSLNQIVGLGVTQLMQVCATGDDDGSMWS